MSDENEFKIARMVITCVTVVLLGLIVVGGVECQHKERRYLECVKKGIDLRMCSPGR